MKRHSCNQTEGHHPPLAPALLFVIYALMRHPGARMPQILMALFSPLQGPRSSALSHLPDTRDRSARHRLQIDQQRTEPGVPTPQTCEILELRRLFPKVHACGLLGCLHYAVVLGLHSGARRARCSTGKVWDQNPGNGSAQASTGTSSRLSKTFRIAELSASICFGPLGGRWL